MLSWSLRSLNFRTRTLLASSVVALAPFVLFAIGVFTEIRSSLIEKARLEHSAILTGILRQVKAQLRSYGDQIELLAKDQRMQSMDLVQMHDALHNFHRFNDFFVSTFVYDAHAVVCTIEHRNHFQGENNLIGRAAMSFSKRFGSELQAVLEKGHSQTYDYLQADETQSFMLFLCPINPFTGEGPPVGVISSRVQLYGHQFQELLDPVELQQDGYCLILDGRGRVIARKGDGLPASLRSVTLEGFDSATDDGGFTRIALAGDRTDLVSVAKMPDIGGTLVVGNPEHQVLGFLTFLTSRLIAFGLVALVLGSLCAFYLSSTLLRPILNLTEGIRKVGEGATGHRLPVEGNDELSQAALAFNRMAAYLQKSKLMERIWKDKWQEPS